jgi:hypothetical protein
VKSNGETVQMTRSDGKLGVEFNPPEELQRFLDFVIKSEDPYMEHYPQILRNGGIIPLDDPEFMKMLDRKGITPYTIPNTMRADYLVAFQKNKASQSTT